MNLEIMISLGSTIGSLMILQLRFQLESLIIQKVCNDKNRSHYWFSADYNIMRYHCILFM